MKREIRRRLFLLDSKESGEALKDMFEGVGGERLEIVLSQEVKLNKLPRDFDSYLIHASNTELESIIELREEQPWCWINLIIGMYGTGLRGKLRGLVDGVYYLLSDSDVGDIIKQMQEYREVGESKYENLL